MNNLISICIPTCQRLELLKETLESCLIQDYEPIEIIISDDSEDDTISNFVKEIQQKYKVEIRYFHNVPPLGQAGNVNKLFEAAKGDKLVLIHDDDLLLPKALTELSKCWEIEPHLTAAFGKQYLISMAGKTLYVDSEKHNNFFYRTSDKQGLQLSSMQSALLQQFPNNGYMILKSAAQSTKYRDENEVKTNRWCDYDFGIRLASRFEKFYFLDKYTAKYRLTDVSISKHGHPVYMYPLIQSLNVDESTMQAKKTALMRLAPIVLRNYLYRNEVAEALQVYFSENYSLRKRLSLRGVYHLFLIASTTVRKFLK